MRFLWQGGAYVSGIILAIWGLYTTAEDAAARNVPTWVWIALGMILIVGSMARTMWEMHQEIKLLRAERADGSGQARDVLRTLKLEGDALLNTWECDHPAGAEQWRKEWSAWQDRVARCLGDRQWGNAAADFASLPTPPIDPDAQVLGQSDDERAREARLGAQVAVLSKLLHP